MPIFAYTTWNNIGIWSKIWTTCWKLIYKVNLTSHRGDSGMKNRPGIKIVQGKIPADGKNASSMDPWYSNSLETFIQWTGSQKHGKRTFYIKNLTMHQSNHYHQHQILIPSIIYMGYAFLVVLLHASILRPKLSVNTQPNMSLLTTPILFFILLVKYSRTWKIIKPCYTDSNEGRKLNKSLLLFHFETIN